MISTKIIKAKGFWKSVSRISLVLIFVLNGFRIAFTYGLDFSEFAEKELSRDHIFMFFVSNILLYVVVGFLIAYFTFRQKQKNNDNR